MFTPPAFEVTEPETLFDFIEQHSFGLIVSQQHESLTGTHLPFLLDRNAGSQGELIGHFAARNEQGNGIDQQSVLVVFAGPHAYVSPRWYAESNFVPTWNYQSVHVTGTVHLVEAADEAKTILNRIVNHYEQALPQPWSTDELPAELFDKLLPQITAFRIEITNIQGQWKLSQNHTAARRERVIAELKQHACSDDQQIAAAMEHALHTER